MRCFGRSSPSTVSADRGQLELMFALLEERGLISMPEKALRLAAPSVAAVFHQFSTHEIREALKEPGDVVVLEAVAHKSVAEEEAALAARADAEQRAVVIAPPSPPVAEPPAIHPAPTSPAVGK